MTPSHLLSVVCGSSFGDILRGSISENKVSARRETRGSQTFWSHIEPNPGASHDAPKPSLSFASQDVAQD